MNTDKKLISTTMVQGNITRRGFDAGTVKPLRVSLVEPVAYPNRVKANPQGNPSWAAMRRYAMLAPELRLSNVGVGCQHLFHLGYQVRQTPM